MIDEFSPLTMPVVLSPDNLRAMRDAYDKLLECMDLAYHEGLSSDQLTAVMRYMGVVYDRLGEVSHMPHRVVWTAQVNRELKRLKRWLLTQLATDHQHEAADHATMIPSWLASAPTEDFPRDSTQFR